MTNPGHPIVRAALSTAITQSMKQRDRAATSLYRSVLGALDNAGAVPLGAEDRVGAVEASPVGVGRTEVPRVELSDQDMIDIVVAESAERTAAADQMAAANPTAAAELRHEARLLELVDSLELGQAPPS